MKDKRTPNEKALQTVWAKGWAAASAGEPVSNNPYPWTHDGARSVFAGVWHKHWRMGWEAGNQVRQVLRWVWKGGTLRLGWKDTDRATVTELGGQQHDVDPHALQELLGAKLIQRGAKSPMSDNWFVGQITDMGLRLLDLPTKAEQRTVHSTGSVDHRGSRARK